MDAVTESIWELIRENADKRGVWVNMRRLWRALSDWSLDGDQCFQEFCELEAYGLILTFIDDEKTQIVIRKSHCVNLVNELPTEHMEPCLQRQRKLAEIRRWAG